MTRSPSDPPSSNGQSACCGEPHVQLRLLSQPRYLAGGRELVAAVARRIGFDELAAGQIALAVDEALANVIRHGYADRPDGPIWLSLWPIERETSSGRRCPVGLKIVIEDEAQQVDPERIRSRDLEDVRPGGLGVHIIRHVMDSCVYSKRSGKGMCLTLEKTLMSQTGA